MKDYGSKRMDRRPNRHYVNKTVQSEYKKYLVIILFSVLSVLTFLVMNIAEQNQAYAVPPVLQSWNQGINSSNSTAISDSLSVLFAEADSFLIKNLLQ